MARARTLRLALLLGLCGQALSGLGPAQAADDKKLRLAMASAFPSSLVQIGTLGANFAKKVTRASNGTLEIKFIEPNVLVKTPDMFNATAEGQIDAAWSSPGLWTAKDSAFALFAAVPFGPSAGEYMAWLFHGGGQELRQELYAQHKIVSLPCGIVAAEAGGWFRKEIKTPDDLKGIRMRFAGMGAKVMERLGVATQVIAGGEIYQALQLGTIDATEYSMPAIDLGLGFHQIARYYYLPGWHQPATMFEAMFSERRWAGLADHHQAIIELACGDNFREGLAEGEAIQYRALEEFEAKGTRIKRWPPAVLAAMEKAWAEVAADEAAKSATFNKIWESYSTFRARYKPWKDLGQLK